MPDDERKSFDKVVVHLKKRFRPIDIAELGSSCIRNHREMTQSNSWVWICKLWEGERFPLLMLRNSIAC